MTYPPGCREVNETILQPDLRLIVFLQINEEIGQDELVRRLKTLAHNFQSMSQADEDTSHTEYTPLALQLADEFFLNHQSRDVGLDLLQLRSIAIPRLPS